MMPGQSRKIVPAACALAALAVGAPAVAFSHGALSLPALALALQIAVPLIVTGWIAARFLSPPVAAPGPVLETVPLSAITDLVTWHDAHGDVLRAGPTVQAVFGTAPAAIQGGGLLRRVLVADRPAFLKALSDASNGSRPVTVQFRVRTGSIEEPFHTSVVFVEMRAQRIAGDASSDATVIAFTRDVSVQHQHARDLESARFDAEKANDLKGRFLATVSHELRTPLNAIIGFSELLAADHPFLVTEDRRKEYAQIIRTSGLHLLEIVNTLLDMSKIETGNFHFDPESFDVRDLAASVCDLMQLKADEAGIVIERKLEAALPEILADRRACRQILTNLLSNAVKFTPRGGTVSVRLAAASNAIVLTIADTGIGIPESDLPRLGDPFFQSGDVHSRNQEGTGLGLSVVRGIVGLHHGEISVESGAGAGTTVTVTLPLRPDLGHTPTKPVVVQTRPRVAARILERKIA